MVSTLNQTPSIKTEFVDRATNIVNLVAAHAEAECPHCLELLKSAVGSNHSSRPTETTTQRNQLQDGTEEYSF